MKVAFLKHPIYEQLAERLLTANTGWKIDFLSEDVAEKSIDYTDYDVLVISFAALRTVKTNYVPLECGALFSTKPGPFLIKRKVTNKSEEINTSTCEVGIAGVNNTPNFLFTYFYPYINKSTNHILSASEIEPWVASTQNRMGLIQSETGTVFKKTGFQLVNDLGKTWLERTILPVPYTVLLVKADKDASVLADLNLAIKTAAAPMMMYDTFYRFDLLADSQGFVAKCQHMLCNDIFVEW
jgi:predicted solute-binding protein